ncbi:unnamed protein product [Cladocopium goreaui]|uniref:CSD domain-containing protein n=1 Tax=Cladocopium goreaui TaxID=2562237 RepID=A0A9P1BIZ2_9DINO|nr:unnamed protein product [Cladocopium goreaui]
MRGRELIKRGWIKTYSRETGWGFIVCNEVERDIFVHWRCRVAQLPLLLEPWIFCDLQIA